MLKARVRLPDILYPKEFHAVRNGAFVHLFHVFFCVFRNRRRAFVRAQRRAVRRVVFVRVHEILLVRALDILYFFFRGCKLFLFRQRRNVVRVVFDNKIFVFAVLIRRQRIAVVLCQIAIKNVFFFNLGRVFKPRRVIRIHQRVVIVQIGKLRVFIERVDRHKEDNDG